MKKIIVKGPVLTRSGYGEQARFALRALRSSNMFDIYVTTINWGQTSWIPDDTEERQWIDEMIMKTSEHVQSGGRFDMSLQVTIPNEFQNMAPINIGYTAGIETTMVAPEWIEAGNAMDKLIVVSNHSKNVYEDTKYFTQEEGSNEPVPFFLTTPIDVVNYPVRNYEKKDLDLDLEYDFNFLCVAQWGPRKNLKNTIRWFIEEFKDQEVGLVVKANIAKNCYMDYDLCYRKIQELLSRTATQRKCKVYLLHGDMTDEEMTGLYNHPKIKAFTILTHGEGYGLPIFEAAYYGLPIIAPAWSGQCDYLFAPITNKKTKKTRVRACFSKVEYALDKIPKDIVWKGVLPAESMWCYPKEKSYKSCLRNMYKNYSFHLGEAKKLKKYITENFTAEKMYDEFVNACIDLGSDSSVMDDDQVVMVV